MESKRHKVIIEKTNSGYSAFVKEARGVVTTGRNEQELKNNIIEALDLFYAPHVYKLKITYQNA
jgi:predicted RNase H-like HicB family nuclease